MYKTTAKIGGMMCGMCESHVADAIRNAIPEAKKVNASKSKGEVTFLTENPVDTDRIKTVIEPTGYVLISVSSEAYEKKGLFGIFRK